MITPYPTPESFALVSDYERFAARNWIKAPGSLDAQLHARAKFEEEVDELIEAVEMGTPADIISEAGDVLWTATANGSNAGISLEKSLQEQFPSHFSLEPVALSDVDAAALDLLDTVDVPELSELLRGQKRSLGTMAKQWFVLSDVSAIRPDTFAGRFIEQKATNARDGLAQTALVVSCVVQRFAGSGLQAVANENRRKLDQRLAQGQVLTKQPRR